MEHQIGLHCADIAHIGDDAKLWLGTGQPSQHIRVPNLPSLDDSNSDGVLSPVRDGPGRGSAGKGLDCP
jgi:hypothetical protein